MPSVVVNIVGDVCLNNIDDFSYLFSEEVGSVFAQADVNVANLEGALTNHDNKLPYRPIHLKGMPKDTLVFRTFDVYCLANNHVMDYCGEGIHETIQFLHKEGKQFFGAGLNREEALAPAVVCCNGIKIGFLAFTRFNSASSSRPGTAPEAFRRICRSIRELKKEGCFVIVYPHWNYQWIDFPAPDEMRKGHRMIESGADIVVGAHPHVIQGVEVYKGKHIFHSLGNFVFRNTKYTKAVPQFGKTMILQVCIRDDLSYDTKIIPAISNDYGVSLISDADERRQFELHLEGISAPLQNIKCAARKFYEASLFIEQHNNMVFGELKKEGGRRAVLRAYMDANFQDVKRKLYALIYKKLGVQIF